jgi:hypothetical protein
LRAFRFVTKTSRKEAVMLSGKEPIATIAVRDLAVAKKFYAGTLGLKMEDDKGRKRTLIAAADRVSSSIDRSSPGPTRRRRSTSSSVTRSRSS